MSVLVGEDITEAKTKTFSEPGLQLLTRWYALQMLYSVYEVAARRIAWGLAAGTSQLSMSPSCFTTAVVVYGRIARR